MELTSGTLIWSIIVVLGILAGLAFRQGSKPVLGIAKGKHLAMILGGIVVVGAVMQLGYLASFGLSPLAVVGEGAPEQVASPSEQVGGTCPVEGFTATADGKCTCLSVEDTTVTFSAKDALNSSATGGTHRYVMNGDPTKTISDAGTVTMSPGDQVKVMWYGGTKTLYYSDVKEYTIPCKGTKTLTDTLYHNDTLDIKVYNDNGDLINNGATNWTVGTGTEKALKLSIESSTNAGIPFGGIMICQINKTAIDKCEVNLGGSSTSTPGSFSPLSAKWTAFAYTVPAFYESTALEGNVVIKADDSFDPTTEADEVHLTFAPNNYYVDEADGGLFKGPSASDENNAYTAPYVLEEYVGID